MKISDTAIKHPTTVYVLMLMLLVFGGYAYWVLPREAAPDVKIPIILVTTGHRGVTPEDIENTVTIPFEKALRGIRDVKQITSKSVEGQSQITVEFYSGTDLDQARQWVRDKIDEAKADLPKDADDPAIKEVNISEFPIMTISLTWKNPPGTVLTPKESDAQLVRMKQMAEDLQDRIEAVSGVLEARVLGGLTRQIRIEFDPDRLASYHIPVTDLLSLIEAENVNVSGGNVEMERGKYQLRVNAEFDNPVEMRNLVISSRGDKAIYVTDVAHIVDGFEDRTSYSRFDGQDSVSLVVSKRAGENIVRIAKEVKTILKNADDILGNHVNAVITSDASKDIGILVEDLESNIVSGLVLIVAVLFLVMGVRNATFVGLAIPFSMLITFAVLMLLGITLNMVVLFSLILSLGMLVDNAIVIVENIYRHMQEGRSRLEAALEGARQVAWPVATSTLTTVVAFFPLLFWPDVVGDFMGYLPKTVIISLSASLFVALVINPTLCGTMMRKPRVKEPDRKPHWFLRGYMVVLRQCIRFRWGVVAGTVAIFVLSIWAFKTYNHGVEFFPESDPPRCVINVKLPEGKSLDATDTVVRRVFGSIGDIPDKKYVVETVGSRGGGNPLGGGAQGSNYGQVAVEFVDRVERTRPSPDTVKQIRERVQGIPGARVEVMKEEHGPPTGSPVTVELSGEDPDELAKLAAQIQARIRDVPGLVDLRNDYEAAKPEFGVAIDRNRAKILGVNTAWVANFLKLAVNGSVVGTYREGEDEYDIVIRLPDQYRYDVNRIRALTVPDATGRQIPLSSLANLKYQGGYGAIGRVDQKRVITVEAGNAEGYKANDVLDAVKKKMADFRKPRGYDVRFRGQDEEQQKAGAFLLKAGIAALFLIALTLVSEFDSVRLPLVIMLAVLLSLIGVIWSMVLTGRPFGIIMTGIGVISLAGVVVNNGIVLIDYMEKLRLSGMRPFDAIVQASATRLRPVLLTAITTSLGLAPMALGVSFSVRKLAFNFNSESSQWWGSMANTVIFGLGVATVLTLFVVPVTYAIMLKLSVPYQPLYGRMLVRKPHKPRTQTVAEPALPELAPVAAETPETVETRMTPVAPPLPDRGYTEAKSSGGTDPEPDGDVVQTST